MNQHLILIFALMTFIHTVNTGAYATRLAGVRTGHPTLAGSLYNVLTLGSRGAHALATPLIASLTDLAVQQQAVGNLLQMYRTMLWAATAGAVIAALLLPTLSRLLARGVASYEMRRSLPRVVVNAASVHGLWNVRHELAAPRLEVLRDLQRSPFPKRFLLASILVTAIATVSDTAAMYASALVPGSSRTAASLTPMLSSFGLFLTIFVVNPIAAIVTDEALRGRRPLKDVTYITIWQVGAQLVGTLAAQALLVPATQVLAAVAAWLVS